MGEKGEMKDERGELNFVISPKGKRKKKKKRITLTKKKLDLIIQGRYLSTETVNIFFDTLDGRL